MVPGISKQQTTIRRRTHLSELRSLVRGETVIGVLDSFEFTKEGIEWLQRLHNDSTKLTVVQRRGAYTDRGFGLKYRGMLAYEERFVRPDTSSSEWKHLFYKDPDELPAPLPPP